MQKQLVKGVFSIAGCGNFHGYYDPSFNWNGWIAPFFTKRTMEKVVALLNESQEDVPADVAEYWRYNKKTDTVESKSSHYEVTGWVEDAIGEVLDDKKLYQVGACDLTWDLAQGKEVS